MTGPATFVVEADGGSRGNPGVAGYGALVRDARTGEVLAERAAPLGIASNNVAEYEGLLAGLRAVLDLAPTGPAAVEVRMDSKLVVEQMSGRWKIKHADMQRLARQARGLVERLRAAGASVEFRWVPRERNGAADALSNVGMDGRTVRRDRAAVPEGSAVGPAAAASAGDAKAPPTFGVARAPLSDVYVSDETVPALEGQTRLVLVRHGVTNFTESHRLDGRGGADPALNATGVAQARAAAAAVAVLLGRSDPGPVTVVSSSLRRARQTGELIADALGVEREQDPDWDEQGFGAWDGLSLGKLAVTQAEQLRRLRADRDWAPEGGETRRDLDVRVGAALGRALARGGTVVVATHRVVLMSVLCRLLGIDHDRAWSIATAPTSITALEVWPDGGVQVAFVNDTHHLHDLG